MNYKAIGNTLTVLLLVSICLKLLGILAVGWLVVLTPLWVSLILALVLNLPDFLYWLYIKR